MILPQYRSGLRMMADPLNLYPPAPPPEGEPETITHEMIQHGPRSPLFSGAGSIRRWSGQLSSRNGPRPSRNAARAPTGQHVAATIRKAEIKEDAWSTLNSDTSRPFDKPKSGRIAVKVINHLGDEVMKVFRVE